MFEEITSVENSLHQLVQKWRESKSDTLLSQIIIRHQEFVTLIQNLANSQQYTFKDINNTTQIHSGPFLLVTFNPTLLHLDLLLVK
jgi:hypothetical protein